jgi:hypothetical protein
MLSGAESVGRISQLLRPLRIFFAFLVLVLLLFAAVSSHNLELGSCEPKVFAAAWRSQGIREFGIVSCNQKYADVSFTSNESPLAMRSTVFMFRSGQWRTAAFGTGRSGRYTPEDLDFGTSVLGLDETGRRFLEAIGQRIADEQHLAPKGLPIRSGYWEQLDFDKNSPIHNGLILLDSSGTADFRYSPGDGKSYLTHITFVKVSSHSAVGIISGTNGDGIRLEFPIFLEFNSASADEIYITPPGGGGSVWAYRSSMHE